MRPATTLKWTTLGLVALLVAGCTLDDKDGPGDGDAGVTDGVAGVCLRLCRHITADCLQMPESELECRSGCEADLGDCSGAELSTLDGCGRVACMPGDTTPVNECIQTVACVGSG